MESLYTLKLDSHFTCSRIFNFNLPLDGANFIHSLSFRFFTRYLRFECSSKIERFMEIKHKMHPLVSYNVQPIAKVHIEVK